MSAGGNGCDEWFGEGVLPYLMLGEELLEVFLLFGLCHGLEFVDGLLHGGFGIAVRLEETRVGGDLVSAQAGLFIDDEPFDSGCEVGSAVGLLDEADGGVGPADLPDQDAGQQEAGNDWEKQNLPQGSFESFKLQAVSSFF